MIANTLDRMFLKFLGYVKDASSIKIKLKKEGRNKSRKKQWKKFSHLNQKWLKANALNANILKI